MTIVKATSGKKNTLLKRYTLSYNQLWEECQLSGRNVLRVIYDDYLKDVNPLKVMIKYYMDDGSIDVRIYRQRLRQVIETMPNIYSEGRNGYND